jgi:hypothetical protein
MFDLYFEFIFIIALVLGSFFLTKARLKLYFEGGSCTIVKSLSGQTVIVTGGNTGIGFETALRLCELDATVVLACRDKQRAETAIECIKTRIKNAKIHYR